MAFRQEDSGLDAIFVVSSQPRGEGRLAFTRRFAAFAVMLVCLACAKPAPPRADRPWTPAERAILASLTPIPVPPPSSGNRVADDPVAVHLGQALFFDTGLSANGKVACATCHQPERWFTDGLPLARGIAQAGRNAPTLLGIQWLPYLFHDGRKDSLWSQATGPLEADVEHGYDRLALAHRIARHYRAPYETLFGPLPPLDDLTRFPPHARPVPFQSSHPHHVAWLAMTEADRIAVNTLLANFGKVLEAYERKLLPQEAPFDRYARKLLANDPTAVQEISPAAQRGLRAFIGRAQCVNCHNGPLFTDKAFHNLALPPIAGQTSLDVGRSLGAQSVKADEFRCGSIYSDTQHCQELRFLNPRFADFLGAFKTPTLRNVARTAPYMHTGQFATLNDVLTFYRTLPGQARVGHRELVLTLLDADVNQADLLAFLETLTGPLPDGQWLHPPQPIPPPDAVTGVAP